MNQGGEVQVRHGYTLRHLDALAKLASIRAFGRTIHDPHERTDIIWCAIVEHLYEATDRPTPAELLRAGTNAIHVEEQAIQYAHGRRQGGKVLDQGGDRFMRYWWARHTHSPETGVVERMAMLQIWPTLKPWQQEALVALAIFEDYTLAAQAVGVSYSTYCARVERARHQFFVRWHEGETPPRLRLDRRRTA